MGGGPMCIGPPPGLSAMGCCICGEGVSMELLVIGGPFCCVSIGFCCGED